MFFRVVRKARLRNPMKGSQLAEPMTEPVNGLGCALFPRPGGSGARRLVTELFSQGS